MLQTSARLDYLSRYRMQLQQIANTPRVMHESATKNWIDYFAYFLAGSGLMVGAISLLTSATQPKLYSLSPIAGLISAGSVSKRDDQHRRVPPSLSTNPSRFATEVMVALDNSLAQIQANDTATQQMRQLTEQLSAAVEQAQQISQSSEPQNPFGQGFD
ncbi:MAG: hypothetical protein AAFQ63_15695 [Cyanobacteria bacterium J06621_11]